MLARLESAAVFGVDAYPVHVEVDVGLGLPFFRMVGLPDLSVRESRDRVRAAISEPGPGTIALLTAITSMLVVGALFVWRRFGARP